MEEVATMKLYTTQRPSRLLAASCAPSVSVLPVSAPVAILAAERAPVSQAHQVRNQAELALAGRVYAINGTTGFVGANGTVKPMTDNASGVPPRGRPV